MSRGDIDLPAYENQYGNGYSRGGSIRRHSYGGDLPPYENQYGSGSKRNKTVSFFSKRLNKIVTFKAKVSKNKRKRNVRRTQTRR